MNRGIQAHRRPLREYMAIGFAFLLLNGCNDLPPTSLAEPAGWVTYTNSYYHFSVDLPPGFRAPAADDSRPFGRIGEKIQYLISQQDPLDCRGDCPVVERTDSGVTVGGNQATRIEGYIGSIGGNIPQQYISYIIPRAGSYYAFTSYALSQAEESTIQDVSLVHPIQPQDIALFEQIMATFKFNE